MANTYRIFERDSTVSVATAVKTKDGKLFQVKPERKHFDSLEDWMTATGMGSGRRLEVQQGHSTSRTHTGQPLTADQQVVADVAVRVWKAVGRKTPHPYRLGSTMAYTAEQYRYMVRVNNQSSIQAALNTHQIGLGYLYTQLVSFTGNQSTVMNLAAYKATQGYKQYIGPWAQSYGANIKAWVEARDPSESVKSAVAALEALAPAWTESETAKNYRAKAEALEEKIRADPAYGNKRNVYATRTPPLLFVQLGDSFQPIFYPKDFSTVHIRSSNGALFETFAGAGVTGAPNFYYMNPKTHVMAPVPSA